MHKSLYGLKQALHTLFKHLSHQFIDFGFLEPKTSYSLFTYISNT